MLQPWVARNSPATLSDDLHPYVRPKFDELWLAAQIQDPYE